MTSVLTIKHWMIVNLTCIRSGGKKCQNIVRAYRYILISIIIWLKIILPLWHKGPLSFSDTYKVLYTYFIFHELPVYMKNYDLWLTNMCQMEVGLLFLFYIRSSAPPPSGGAQAHAHLRPPLGTPLFKTTLSKSYDLWGGSILLTKNDNFLCSISKFSTPFCKIMFLQ